MPATATASSVPLKAADPPRRRQCWQRVTVVSLVLAALGLGILVGFLIRNATIPLNSAGGGSSSSIEEGGQLAIDGMQHLPPPGSEAALQLQRNPNTPGMFLALYTHASDAKLITTDLTEAFLQQLQLQLQQQLQPSANSTAAIDFAPFVRVAQDVLSYLRFSDSVTLLSMLRQFASTGSLPLGDFRPEDVRHEVLALLNVTNLNAWYAETSSNDVAGFRTITPPLAAAAATASSVLESGAAAAGAPAARRALPASAGSRRLLQRQPQRHHARRLAAAESIPTIVEPAAAGAEDVIPTVSPEQRLTDMLCAISDFSPTGLAGVVNSSTKCSAPDYGLFKYSSKSFRPVVIPVAFHVQRFMLNGTLMPPLWEPEAAARNLIDATNRFYKDTGVQFRLHEVRHDPAKWGYLNMQQQADWNACSGYPDAESGGFACLTETARFPQVAALAEQHIVNVLVSGSTSRGAGLCPPDDAVCSSLYLGYSRAMGPWFAEPSPTWAEGAAEENWIFINFDQLDPSAKNDARFFNGGAVTLAHELGHYLGLMHTHEGQASPCEGSGLRKADEVPDTPANEQIDAWAGGHGLLPALAGWCSDFRAGKAPAHDALLAFNSCGEQAPGHVDNIFNLMSYLPDACCMLLTPNQVARLQWSIITWRPKMFDKYKV